MVHAPVPVPRTRVGARLPTPIDPRRCSAHPAVTTGYVSSFIIRRLVQAALEESSRLAVRSTCHPLGLSPIDCHRGRPGRCCCGRGFMAPRSGIAYDSLSAYRAFCSASPRGRQSGNIGGGFAGRGWWRSGPTGQTQASTDGSAGTAFGPDQSLVDWILPSTRRCTFIANKQRWRRPHGLVGARPRSLH